MIMERCYSDLLKLEDYGSKLEYLKLLDNNAESPRSISMEFYKSDLWKLTRKEIISRDLGFDLGVFGMYIEGPIYVHHINPISKEDIINDTRKLTDPENLICTSHNTHIAIHYKKAEEEYVERRPGDTILW